MRLSTSLEIGKGTRHAGFDSFAFGFFAIERDLCTGPRNLGLHFFALVHNVNPAATAFGLGHLSGVLGKFDGHFDLFALVANEPLKLVDDVSGGGGNRLDHVLNFFARDHNNDAVLFFGTGKE